MLMCGACENVRYKVSTKIPHEKFLYSFLFVPRSTCRPPLPVPVAMPIVDPRHPFLTTGRRLWIRVRDGDVMTTETTDRACLT